VTGLLLGGLATDDIATRLSISRHTLRDHVKAIFTKMGVGSRPELTAQLAHEPAAT
jgi:DNA-binding CsgD family transcriptional regulator